MILVPTVAGFSLARRVAARRGCRRASPWTSVLPVRFHLNSQDHLLTEAVLHAGIHAEVGAVKDTVGIGSTDLALEDRMIRHALERVDPKHHGPRHAVQRQIPVDSGRRALHEIREGAFVLSVREMGNVEAVPLADLFVHY